MPHFDIMDPTGHSVWPPKGMFRPEAEFNSTYANELRAGAEKFAALQADGYTMWKETEPGKPHVKAREFDPTVERTLAVPQLYGG